MIVRIKKSTKYTAINNTVLEDERLSWRARGIAAYLLTKPDDWEINHVHLWKNGTEGRDAVLSAMKELEDCGYLVRTRIQKPDGKFETSVALYEEPQPAPDNPTDSGKPEVGLPGVGKPDVGFPEVILNTEYQVLTTNKRSASQPAAQEKPPPKEPTPQQELFGAICEAIGWDHHTLSDKDKGQVAQACGILSKAGYTVADVRTFMSDVWFNDWRWKKDMQHPTLAQLRQEIGKIHSTVKAHAPPPKRKGVDGFREMLEEQGIKL